MRQFSKGRIHSGLKTEQVKIIILTECLIQISTLESDPEEKENDPEDSKFIL